MMAIRKPTTFNTMMAKPRLQSLGHHSLKMSPAVHPLERPPANHQYFSPGQSSTRERFCPERNSSQPVVAGVFPSTSTSAFACCIEYRNKHSHLSAFFHARRFASNSTNSPRSSCAMSTGKERNAGEVPTTTSTCLDL